MEQDLAILLLTTLSVGFVHTLIGPDHYLPFIVLSKSRKWSLSKTIGITTICGISHVLSAVLLGVAATSIASLLNHLDIIESLRGEVAAWLLISFGFVYCIWGIRSAIKNKTHHHKHLHEDGFAHNHSHSHSLEHTHVHTNENGDAEEKDQETKPIKELTPWILFVIFIFGPCEPLIPLVMYPAVQASLTHVILVTLVFGISTLFVMLSLVIGSYYGAKKMVKFPFFERYGNAIAGGIICSCGLAMNFLGL